MKASPIYKRIFVLFFPASILLDTFFIGKVFPFQLLAELHHQETGRGKAPCVSHTLAVHRVSAASVQASASLCSLTHTTPPSLSLLIKRFLQA